MFAADVAFRLTPLLLGSGKKSIWNTGCLLPPGGGRETLSLRVGEKAASSSAGRAL